MYLLSVFLAWMLPYFGRRFVAYTLFSHIFSHVWEHPARHCIAKQLSAAIDGYCNMLTVLADSMAILLGFQGTEGQAVPGAWPLDDMPTLRASEHEPEPPCIIFSSLEHNKIRSAKEVFSTEMKSMDHDLDQFNLFQTPTLSIISSSPYPARYNLIDFFHRTDSSKLDSPYLSAPEVVTVPVKERVHSKGIGSSLIASSIVLAHKQLPLSPKLIHKVDYPSKVTATPISTPNPNATKKHERSQKYARMRTLKLPGRQMRPMKAPTETMLALRRIDEELAIEESKLVTHCARELVGDGIFTQLPTTLYSGTARQMRRETSVGPVNPEWSGRHARDVPSIRVIKPEDYQAPRAIGRPDANSSRGSPGSNATTGNRERVQSSAAYAPSKPLSSLSPLSPAHINSPSSTQDNLNGVSNNSGITIDSKLSADQRKRLSKNRASMSDWLAAISASNNTLVADHVATKAGLTLRVTSIFSPLSTPPLSPTGSSSSDSSTPSTPVDAFFLPPPMVEETKTGYASSDCRRRARCSYSGDEYEMIVAPAIPEDLLTEEIGVAC